MKKNYTIKTVSGMDCLRFGEGPETLVILPGMSLRSVLLTSEAVSASFSAFTDRFTVFLFDRKKDIHEGYSVFDMAEDTYSAMQCLGISGAAVYGASQGAMMAMAIAVRHPDAVAKLALASTSSRPDERQVATMSEWAALSRAGDVRALNRSVFSKVYSPAYRERYREAFEALEGMGTDEEMRRFAILADATASFNIYSELDGIRCPVFLYGVENDTVLGTEGVRDIADRLGCKLSLYPGDGHAAYDEDSGFLPSLLNFLKG